MWFGNVHSGAGSWNSASEEAGLLCGPRWDRGHRAAALLLGIFIRSVLTGRIFLSMGLDQNADSKLKMEDEIPVNQQWLDRWSTSQARGGRVSTTDPQLHTSAHLL